jgi:nitric oxide dioxygenase
MLTTEHRAIVSATVPILEQGGETLTRHFYQLLFRDFPQVKPYFNQAHQQSGAQQRALAGAVLMYAKNIDRLEALGPLASTIVNKHVALQISPEHYPMVGASLLKAISEVLGADVATEAVLEAWAAAYGQLADILIGAEAKAYEAQAQACGGWNGLRRFVVIEKRPESEEITTFVLQPQDGAPVMAFLPGQYIGIRVMVGGQEQRRQYSLSAASNSVTYQISIKRQPDGKVSNLLHDQVEVGNMVDLLPPSGAFTLTDSDKPLVLISGGVGITATLPMLERALEAGRDVHFIHAARHSGVHAFRDKLEALESSHPRLRNFYLYAEHSDVHPAPHAVGLLDSDKLAAWLPESRNVDAYFLGPTPFMRVVKHSLQKLGVPESQIHYEFFGPAEALN